MTDYRLKVDNTYSSTTNATNIANSINSVMSAQGFSERAVANGTNVYLMVAGMTEDDAVSLRDAIRSAWSGSARTFGKVSVVRTNDAT